MTREDARPDGSSHQDGGDYMAVRASGRLFHLDPSLSYEVIQGYINSNNQPTNASLCAGLIRNFISHVHVAQLGLDVEYVGIRDENNADAEERDTNRGMPIDFGGDDMQSVIGTATFSWKQSQPENYLRPLTITCQVVEFVPLQTQLVFGQEYLDKRNHYWGR
jgi:hypothetical protein